MKRLTCNNVSSCKSSKKRQCSSIEILPEKRNNQQQPLQLDESLLVRYGYASIKEMKKIINMTGGKMSFSAQNLHITYKKGFDMQKVQSLSYSKSCITNSIHMRYYMPPLELFFVKLLLRQYHELHGSDWVTTIP